MSLPADKRPRQTPITRAEESGDVILASHPELRKVVETMPTKTTSVSKYSQTKQGKSRYQFLGLNRKQLLIPVIVAAAAAVIGSILILAPGSTFNPANNLTILLVIPIILDSIMEVRQRWRTCRMVHHLIPHVIRQALTLLEDNILHLFVLVGQAVISPHGTASILVGQADIFLHGNLIGLQLTAPCCHAHNAGAH